MQGTRLPDAVWGEAGSGWDAWKARQPGDYMRVEWPRREPPEARVTWYICDPLGKAGQIGGRRSCTEHPHFWRRRQRRSRRGDHRDLVTEP